MAECIEKVWGVFVGDNGDQLETFNCKDGPFPPKPGSEGFVSIGWPAVGDMSLYKGNYADFVDKFRIVYDEGNERVLKTQANMVWNFAFTIAEGDWVICPSSSLGYMLIGRIAGDYVANYHGEKSLPVSNMRRDFVHLRKVKWLYVVSAKDSRYGKLNRIGQLTVTQQDISVEDLKSVLNGAG